MIVYSYLVVVSFMLILCKCLLLKKKKKTCSEPVMTYWRLKEEKKYEKPALVLILLFGSF